MPSFENKYSVSVVNFTALPLVSEGTIIFQTDIYKHITLTIKYRFHTIVSNPL